MASSRTCHDILLAEHRCVKLSFNKLTIVKCSCPVDWSRPQPNNPNFVTHWFSNRNLARCYPGRNCWIPYFAFQDLKNLYLMRHCIDPIFCAVHCHPKSSIFFQKNHIGMFDELNRSRTVSWRTDGRKMEKKNFKFTFIQIKFAEWMKWLVNGKVKGISN